MMRRTLAILSLVATSALAQAPAAHVVVPTIAARPEDVGSIDGIIKAYYEVITGPVLSRLYGAPIEVLRVGGRIFVMSGDHDVERDPHRHEHHDHEHRADV